MLGHAGIVDPSIWFTDTRFLKQGMDRIIFLIIHKRIMANNSAIWKHAAHTIDQLSSPSF